MTFARLTSLDIGAIARAEQARRAALPAPDLSAMTGEQRQQARERLRADPGEWAAIVTWSDWLQGFDLSPWPPSDQREMAEHLAAVTLRTAKAAMRGWYRDGCPKGEPEARACLLLTLSRAFARMMRHPIPTIDGAGNFIFPEPQRNAA